MKPIAFYANLAMFLLTLTFSVNAQAMKGPEQVVKETVDTMVNAIQKNRDAYKADEQALYAMLDETLIPAIHMSRMADQILGKTYARSSSKEKKAEFAEVFKDFIVTTYASGLLSATGKEKVNYKPVNLKPGQDIVKIEAELVSASGLSLIHI